MTSRVVRAGCLLGVLISAPVCAQDLTPTVDHQPLTQVKKGDPAVVRAPDFVPDRLMKLRVS